MKKGQGLKNYIYDDHSTIPFKLVHLKPSQENEKETPHRHNFFQIFFFLQTGGKHLIDFKEFSCAKHSVHIVNPGSIHKLDRNERTSGYVLLFSRSFFRATESDSNYFLFRNDFEKSLVLSNEDFTQIETFIGQIDRENEQKQVFKSKVIQALLHSVVIHIQRKIEFQNKSISSQSDKLYRQFTELVNNNFHQEHTVSFYTEKLHVESSKLNQELSQAVEKSASNIIQERILLEAKRLLFHSNQSVKEIAFKLGYEDPSYFNRFFKSKLGQTPVQFREEIKEKYH